MILNLILFIKFCLAKFGQWGNFVFQNGWKYMCLFLLVAKIALSIEWTQMSG
jgi:hypothetical protein